MATGTITDTPRFAWRGAMLDVARHFFSVKDVTSYIDLLAYYKINRLHLHLTDDQGWRIQIQTRANLVFHGGAWKWGALLWILQPGRLFLHRKLRPKPLYHHHPGN